MAYGVYLQNHYTYHSKWFHRTNLVMDFFVNLELLVSPVGFVVTGTVIQGASTYFLSMLSNGVWTYAILILLFWLLSTAGLTAVTAHFIRRGGIPSITQFRLTLNREQFSWRKALPALCPVLLTLYWCLFYSSTSLPEFLYRAQSTCSTILLVILVILTVVYLPLIKRPWMLISAGGMLLGCLFMRGTLTNWAIDPYTHTRFARPSWATFVLAAALAVFYLLCCFVGVKKGGTNDAKGCAPPESGQ
jgi:hypothetical protein